MPRSPALIAALFLASPAFATSMLDGAWELQSGQFVDAQGKRVDYAELKLQGIKVLDAGSFAFTTTADGRFWAGGAGRYAVEADRYTESPRMASYPLEGDGHYGFHYVLDGDTWTLERRDAQGAVLEREVWQRIEAAP